MGGRRATTPEIARWVAAQLGIEPLVWEAQAVTVSYERARGLRAVGEHADGFAITASRTVAVPVERLFDVFSDEALRERWLPGGSLRERTSTRPKSARFDWGDGDTRVNVGFTAKGEDEEHRRARARAASRRRGGRADEGLVARAPGRAQAAARGR